MSSVIVGTVISGTMRQQDLLPAFAKELINVGGSLGGIHIPEEALMNDEHAYWDEDFWLDMEVLENRLQEYAPEGYYFGSHPGDGANFGWWEIDDENI